MIAKETAVQRADVAHNTRTGDFLVVWPRARDTNTPAGLEVQDIFAQLVGIQSDAPLNVLIDVKPGGAANPVNPRSNGMIPVAILTTDRFDAANVDAATVRFGRTGAEAAPVQSAMEDVDRDGWLDMILHFRIQQTGIRCGDASASLTGMTIGGGEIRGTDSIETVSCN